MPVPLEFAGYSWKVKKVTRPGETEPVIQMHLVPPEEELHKQRDDHATLMRELERNGYITLPPDLARVVNFSRWDPKNPVQTSRVLDEMARKDT